LKGPVSLPTNIKIERCGLWICILAAALGLPGLTLGQSYEKTSFSQRFEGHLDSVQTNYLYAELFASYSRHAQKAHKRSAPNFEKTFAKMDLPVPSNFNTTVKHYIELYTIKKHRSTEALLGLGKSYFPMIEEQLAARNMPEEIKYLPVVLSGLDNQAQAPWGAVGMWQLSHPVARKYGLSITRHIDERKDEVKATQAALAYLHDLFDEYRDWNLTLLAFASSPAAVNAALSKCTCEPSSHHVNEMMPAAFNDLIPAYLATVYVFENPRQNQLAAMEVNPWPEKEVLTLERNLRYRALEDILGIKAKQLRALNPLHTKDELVAQRENFLPPYQARRVSAHLDTLYYYQDSVLRKPKPKRPMPEYRPPAEPPPGTKRTIYTVKSGDNLGFIAEAHGVRVSQIRSWNAIWSDRIDVGQEIVLYLSKKKADEVDKRPVQTNKPANQQTDKPTNPQTHNPTNPKTPKPKLKPDHAYVWYTVKSGESLWLIARKYPGVSSDNIMELNGIGPNLDVGQRIRIKLKRR
jgi:membrane-bound lytic murein transglycosylase D